MGFQLAPRRARCLRTWKAHPVRHRYDGAASRQASRPRLSKRHRGVRTHAGQITLNRFTHPQSKFVLVVAPRLADSRFPASEYVLTTHFSQTPDSLGETKSVCLENDGRDFPSEHLGDIHVTMSPIKPSQYRHFRLGPTRTDSRFSQCVSGFRVGCFGGSGHIHLICILSAGQRVQLPARAPSLCDNVYSDVIKADTETASVRRNHSKSEGNSSLARN